MELSIDTASEIASVAISREGRLEAEITWRCRRNHTVELLPTIERLLMQSGTGQNDLTSIFVCIGPGMYTGLRVGISTAQGLARGFGIPTFGVGRLELDAYPYASFPGTIVAVHRAGRGELAWAAYGNDPWREVSPPQLSAPAELARTIEAPSVVVGEVDDKLAALLDGHATTTRTPESQRRAGTLAELAYPRLVAGQVTDPALLRPIYLRPPAIGPQQPLT